MIAVSIFEHVRNATVRRDRDVTEKTQCKKVIFHPKNFVYGVLQVRLKEASGSILKLLHSCPSEV